MKSVAFQSLSSSSECVLRATDVTCCSGDELAIWFVLTKTRGRDLAHEFAGDLSVQNPACHTGLGSASTGFGFASVVPPSASPPLSLR